MCNCYKEIHQSGGKVGEGDRMGEGKGGDHQHDHGPKEYSLHVVGLFEAAQIVLTPPAPRNGGPFLPFFWAGRPSGPAGWLALLLLKAGDVETNPGPKHTRTQVWICDICHREITRKQTSLRCNHSEHWVHLRCAHIHVDQYTDTWICHLHRGSRLPHATYISPHFPLASSKPLLHSPPTPLTPPHPKHQHTSNSPTSPPKMTNPSLPKPLIHSPPTPPTPPPAKQIHISHKTPSPSTTPRTSNAAECPVPVSLPSATNTQVTLNTTIATPIATALPTQTHHTDRVVLNSDKTRTIRTAHTTSIHKPSSNNERNLIILQVNINGINNKLEELKTRMQTTSQFRKPSSPLNLILPKYQHTRLFGPTGHTSQGVGLSRSSETT